MYHQQRETYTGAMRGHIQQCSWPQSDQQAFLGVLQLCEQSITCQRVTAVRVSAQAFLQTHCETEREG
jgi:hypothetical protein